MSGWSVKPVNKVRFFNLEPFKVFKNMYGIQILQIVFAVIAGLFLVAIGALIGGIVTEALWNTLMPDLFGLKEVSFWQAVGLNLLGGCLFKSSSTCSNSK